MTISLDDSYRYCEQITRHAAKNFYYSFLLLPREKRLSLYAIYAFMRYCDDAVDEPVEYKEQISSVAMCREQLDMVLNKTVPDHPLFPAFIDSIDKYNIPSKYLYEVLEGMEMDLVKKRYETFEELKKYCYHAASAVGLVTLQVFGYSKQDKVYPLAVDCGIALQMTNIIRDLKEDAYRDRIYFPRCDWNQYGLSEDDFKTSRPSSLMTSYLSSVVQQTEQFYQSAYKLIPYIDKDSRCALSAMIDIYHHILLKIKDHNYDVFSRRISLPPLQKIGIGLKSVLREKI